MMSRDGFPSEIWRGQTSITNRPSSAAKYWRHLLSSGWIAPLYNAVYEGCPGSVRLYHQCGSSEGATWPAGRWLQQVQGPPESSLGSLQLGQETVSLPHSREPLFDSQSPVPTLTFLSFCVWGYFILCFACAIERQFLQLSYPVTPLPWDSCCQEKTVLTLKQRWHCAI